jgi:hypothetical protein
MSEDLTSTPVTPEPSLSTTEGQQDAPLPSVPVVTTPPVPLIYIGPVSPNFGLSPLAIYPELPERAQVAIEANPALAKLFITLDKWKDLKGQIINTNGNLSWSGSTKHAVDYLMSRGVL